MYPLIFGFEKKEAAAESLKELGAAGTEDEKLFLKLLAGIDQKSTIDLGYRVIEQQYIEGRFHHIGFSIEPDKASVCVQCHGIIPHDLSKEVRSFLNMHSFYIACETCHIYPEEGNTPMLFRWYSKKTGELISNPVKLVELYSNTPTGQNHDQMYVTHGNYDAKIAPGMFIDGEFKFIKRGNLMDYVQTYLEKQEMLDHTEKSQAKNIIHRNVNIKPILCDQCHNKEKQYIPFAELGYPPRRVAELTDTEVVGMIKKYKEFWIPSIMKPGIGQESE